MLSNKLLLSRQSTKVRLLPEVCISSCRQRFSWPSEIYFARLLPSVSQPDDLRALTPRVVPS